MLDVRNLSVGFPVAASINSEKSLMVLRNVSFSVEKGKSFAIVGESGSGKSTLARSIVGLIGVTSGEIYLEGEKISSLKPNETRRLRRRMQLILQDPRASMDPRFCVYDVLKEALVVHGLCQKPDEQKHRILTVIHQVGLNSSHLDKYVHELSGGQRQRVAIARAIICEPDILILDEPVSALDVSIQAQIINLLVDLQEELGLTYILISHDLALVSRFADHTGVMYLGRISEQGRTAQICAEPAHPYTQSLLSLVASSNPLAEKQKEIHILQGNPPSPLHVPTGCAFHTRCPKVAAIANSLPAELVVKTEQGLVPLSCISEEPQVIRNDAQVHVSCHFPNSIGGAVLP